MTDQHDRFLGRLDNSTKSMFAVAEWLVKKGQSVEVAGLRYAPTAAEANAYIDHGDLFIKKRLEVRGRDVIFTNKSNWPYDSMFVSSVAVVERAKDVEAYIVVSADLRHAAIVTTQSRPHWVTVEKRMSNTGNVERAYACPLDFIHFVRLS